MPNWSYARICFKGKPDDINRLRENVSKATKWSYKNPYWTNLRYFFSLSGFDSVSYRERFSTYYDRNFRGNILDTWLKSEEDGEYLLYYPSMESAWWTDYEVLQLITMLYNVEFSAYSEEPGIGIYDKCKNGTIDTYDFDYSIVPDYEQFEAAIDEDPDGLDLDYDNPVKNGSEEEKEILKILRDHNIDYDARVIDNIPVPVPYGVYYHYIYGVCYDKNKDNINYNYPDLDPFNINIT